MKTAIVRMIIAACFGAVVLTGCEQRLVSPDDEYTSGGSYDKNHASILDEDSTEVEFDAMLDSLHLTADQLAAIDLLKTQKKECSDSAHSKYNQGRSAWAKAYQAERKAVKDSLKAGVISRDSSQRLMFEIAKRQSRDTVDKSNRDTLKLALKACQETYNAGFYALLTAEQKVIWDAWVATHTADKDGKDDDEKDDDKDSGNGKGKGKDTEKVHRTDKLEHAKGHSKR